MLRSVSLFALLLSPAVVSAQTDPTLWRFIHPHAKAVISIDWKTLKGSHVGALLREKFVDGNPGSAIPGIEFLDDVDRCIISSPGRAAGDETSEPPLLIVVRGHFDLAKVRNVLTGHGAKPQLYNSIQVYRPQGKNGRDMAFVLLDAQTILIGDAGSIFASLEGSTNPTPAADASAILARAAEMDLRYDVWALMTGLQAVANDRLMGLLAGGALGSQARGFEAGVSLRNGLVADISFLFPTEPEARSMASEFSKLMKAALKDKLGGPVMLDLERKLKVAADGAIARISLRLTPQELEKNARIFAASRLQPQAAVADIRPVVSPTAPVPPKPEPKVIRIEGLDEGTREIQMKPIVPSGTPGLSHLNLLTFGMAKGKRELVEVRCPCCEATLQIDPELKAVISYTEHKKPPSIEDIGAAVQKLKGEEARRGEVFQKSFEQHKSHHKVLERKFDELLKQAKDNPNAPPPKKPFDFD